MRTLHLNFAKTRKLDPRVTFSRGSIGTYCGPDGKLKVAQANEPRFDFDPITLACRGLLIEEARTNLLTYSEQFDNVIWARSNITAFGSGSIANATIAPDGNTTADKIVELLNGSNTTHSVYYARTGSNETVTASVYVKAAERSRIRMEMSNFATNSCGAFFDVSAGTVLSTDGANADYTAPTASISAVGNGWYRCMLTVTKGSANTTNNLWIGLVSTGTTQSYPGDGSSGIYLWGAQVETGGFATSYIPTTSAQVTRAMDSASLSGANLSSWYNQSEGTFVVYGDAQVPNSTYPCFARIQQDANNFFSVGLLRADDKKFSADAKVASNWTVDLRGNTFTAGSSLAQALAYKTNDWAVSNNGAMVLLDTVNSTIAPALLQIGFNYATDAINGHIACLSYYNERLPNWMLQTLSSYAGSAVPPSFIQDFAKTRRLDPRITFTRGGAATYWGSDGKLKTALANEPRFEYHPLTKACLGFLIEESRTNWLTYSEQFNNNAWGKLRAAYSSITTTAPDGALTGNKIIEDTTLNNNHVVYQSASVTTALPYTASIFMKAGERTKVRLVVSVSFPGSAETSFDLSAGTILVTGAGATSASITPVGNGWYRCTVTATANATGTGNFNIYLQDASGNLLYNGDGNSGLYVWGAQLEQGSFATSYIPTTSSTVIRPADLASMLGSNFSSWYRQDEGTFLVEAYQDTVKNYSGTFRHLLMAGDASAQNYVNVLVSSSNALQSQVSSGNTSQSSISSGTNTGIPFRVAATYKVNDFAISGNGNTVVTDTAGSVPVAVDRLSIGGTITGNAAGAFNGHLARLAYYPASLKSNLQSLSA